MKNIPITFQYAYNMLFRKIEDKQQTTIKIMNHTQVLNSKKQQLSTDHDHNWLYLSAGRLEVDIELNEVAARKLLKGIQKFLDHREKLKKEM